MSDTFEDELIPKDEETSCYKDSTDTTQVGKADSLKESSSPLCQWWGHHWRKCVMLVILVIVLLHLVLFYGVDLTLYDSSKPHLEGDAVECDYYHNCTGCVTDGCLYECHCSGFNVTSESCLIKDKDNPGSLSTYQGLWKCRKHLVFSWW